MKTPPNPSDPYTVIFYEEIILVVPVNCSKSGLKLIQFGKLLTVYETISPSGSRKLLYEN